MLRFIRKKHDPTYVDPSVLATVIDSGLFDPGWYADRQSLPTDPAGGSIMHFCLYGLDQHLDPGPNFSTRRYLASLNLGARAIARPFLHAMTSIGAGTARPPWLPDDDASFTYLLHGSGLLDVTWYLAANPDVARAGIDAIEHFVRYGAAEGRDPGPAFDSRLYAQHFPDHSDLCRSPAEHYLRIGRAIGFKPDRSQRDRSQAGFGGSPAPFGIEAQDAVRDGAARSGDTSFAYPVARHTVDLTELGHDELRALIAELDKSADRVGCVIFDHGRCSDRVAVIFAGNRERFYMLSVAARLACPVIYVQDFESGWYQGSRILPDLPTFCARFLVPEVGRARALLFGQSSGAYAALVASTYLAAPTVVACAPQTFSDAAFKAGIGFVGVRALVTPDDLIDLNVVLRGCEDFEALRVVAIAAGELENPITSHYWMDYLHCLRVADAPSVAAFVVNDNTHVIVHGRVSLFAGLLERLVRRLDAPPTQRRAIVEAFFREVFDTDAP
ncbi:hypothetical protein MKK55_10020 [Methylobacterium sp. J-059]|uniref:hypothetical protein n=1 Tax=Methylobacterium sp. J-059 TaxID=2836643 RepID=UPI001FBBDEF2|nr:hypothetical protein [Methylobacterium sp. J-059]MCJ2039274.1 hypothetical protein [Methylobacterium sp. J-059]